MVTVYAPYECCDVLSLVKESQEFLLFLFSDWILGRLDLFLIGGRLIIGLFRM